MATGVFLWFLPPKNTPLFSHFTLSTVSGSTFLWLVKLSRLIPHQTA